MSRKLEAQHLVTKPPRSKPFFRGWLHAGAAAGAWPLAVELCAKSISDLPRFFSMLVFGFSMIALYTVSAIYHIFSWRGVWERLWHTFDHSNIFIFIAGTYTAICYNVLPGWERFLILGLVWAMALTGVLLTVFRVPIPRWTKTGLYIGLGWTGVLIVPAILAVLPWTALVMMLLGGLLYTIGALVFAWRKPNPFPRFFGFHEIFHLFVIAGGSAFALTIWVWVIPLVEG